MARSTKKDPNEKSINNLKSIGLNINRIPAFLKKSESLKFRPSKSYDDTIYKVYEFVNIKDLEILITPCDRLTELTEKYELSSPLSEYLDKKTRKNADKYATFMELAKTIDLQRIKELEDEQNELKKKIPYEVKYKNNYVWQIYYSDFERKYFMLATTKEQDNNALFYVIKKKIEANKSKKDDYIFVPITHLDYAGLFLTKSEIEDIENYLWYFTKEWPNVYEVVGMDKKLFMKVVGTARIYDRIKTTYSIKLSTKEEALEFYKLLKAMFILATGAKQEYTFTTKINKDGDLEFWNNDNLLQYKNLPEYIKSEYEDKVKKLKEETKEQSELERKLGRFKEIVEDLTQEYLLRQRQIATFLECKKTFFGKVKYFFRRKKNKDEQIEKPKRMPEKKEAPHEKENLKELYEAKDQYTIEDLISICTKLEEVKKENSNLWLDIKAMERKKDILSKKVDNAELYLREIDEHKKSIFEFWKFTSKDEVQTLNEAEEDEEVEKNKMKKYFDYEDDLEDLGKIIDETQRRKLSKNETDAVFAFKQVPSSFRELDKEKETDVKIFVEKKEEDVEKDKKTNKSNYLEKDLQKLKSEYEKDITVLNTKDFDVFGGLVEDKTKVKTINNEDHRETEKDKFNVLNVNLDTDIKVYSENIENYLKLIKESLNKIKSPYDMSVYCINNSKNIDGINVFNMNPKNALKEELHNKKSKLILCKINIKENTPAVFYTNIMFYDNFNKTLPVGMNLSTELILDTNKLNLEFVKEDSFYINYKIDEFNYDTRKVTIYEYDSNYDIKD